MATIIDALVVTLGFDTKGMKRGEAEAASAQKRVRDDAIRTRKTMDESARNITASITAARNAALGLFGVMAAGRGVSSLVNEATQSSAALGRMARNLNMTTEALSAYESVSRQAGNAAGEMTAAFEATQNQIQQFRLLGGAMPGLATFRRLGVDLADSSGRMRGNEEITRDVIAGLRRFNPEERGTIASSLGYGQGLVNMAALPPARMNEMLAQARANGVTPVQSAAAQAREAAWVRLDAAVIRVTNVLLTGLTPTINFVLQKLEALATTIGENLQVVFNDLDVYVRRFAEYLGSNEFREDMAAFVGGIQRMARAIIAVLRYFGALPAAAQTADEPGTTTVAPGEAAPEGMVVVRDMGVLGRIMRPARPGETPAPPAGAPIQGPPSTSDAAARERQAYEHFRSPAGGGYTHEQAAGLIANIRQESNFNPNATHDGGIGFGIAGWNNNGERPGRPGRLTRLGEFIGRDPRTATYDEQLRFATHELSERGDEAPAGRRLRGATTANDAGQIGSASWLRPLERQREMAVRGASAEGAARRMAQPGGPAAPPTDAPTPTPPAASGELTPEQISRLGPEAMAAYLQSQRDRRGGVPAPPPQPDPALVPGAGGAALRDNARPNQTSSNETSIGTVSVITQATDAGGIARDIGAALRRTTFVDQATRGLA